MSVIHLGDLIINKNLSSIIVDKKEVTVEPKLFELLLLFCHNPEKIITRQQILDLIWPDTIVTDNAVNKLVASLRKILKDNPKSPKYIQTVPKRGYRLVAELKYCEQQLESTTEPNINKPTDIPTLDSPKALPAFNKKTISVTIVAFIILCLFVFRHFNNTDDEYVNSLSGTLPVKELTRMPGLERSPLMSPNQKFIVYLRENNNTGHRTLWQKNLLDEQAFKITGITPYVSRLIALNKVKQSWQLIYLAQENEQCHISVAEIMGEQVSANNRLLDCTGLRVFDVAYSPTNQQLYYSAKSEHESQARVYQLDIKSRASSLVTQPGIRGAGNRGIDISPDESKLLIVQIDKNYQSQLHILDLQMNELTPGLVTQHSMANATWAHDSKHIMFFEQFPSRQIILSDVQGKTQKVIVNMSNYIETHFSRIENSKDLIFSTINQDFNNLWLASNGSVQQFSNSTVYDMHPTLAHSSLNYAFVSTRAGSRQFYYGDLATGSSQVISMLKEHRIFTNLSFSPNDQYLLTMDKSHIWLIDVKAQLNSPELNAFAFDAAKVKTKGTLQTARWLNNELIYFQTKNNGKLKGFIYNSKSHSSVEVDNRWRDIFSAHDRANTLYMVDAADNQIYKMPFEQLNLASLDKVIIFPAASVSSTGIRLPDSYLDIKMHADKFYYFTTANSGNTQRYDYQIEVQPLNPMQNKALEVYKSGCSCGYDVSDSGVIVSTLSEVEGDVLTTVH